MGHSIHEARGLSIAASTLRSARLELALPPTPGARAERLLATCFRALCRVMQAAAQFSGTTPVEDTAASGAFGELAPLDLQVLCLSASLPLCEIAAAERERMWRVEAARSDAPKERRTAAEGSRQVLH